MGILTDTTRHLVSKLRDNTYSDTELYVFKTELSNYIGYELGIRISVYTNNHKKISLYINRDESLAWYNVIPQTNKKTNLCCETYFTNMNIYNSSEFDVSIYLDNDEYFVFNYNRDIKVRIPYNEIDEFSTEICLNGILNHNNFPCDVKLLTRIMKLHRHASTNNIVTELLEFSTERELQEKLYNMYNHIL